MRRALRTSFQSPSGDNPEFDTVDIGGHNFAASKKFRDAEKTGRAAFVVDDVLPPWAAAGGGGPWPGRGPIGGWKGDHGELL